MANPIIKIKRSAVAGRIPTTTSLELGELAINTYDGKVYIQQDQGGVGIGSTVVVVNPWSVGLGSTAYNLSFTAGSVGIGTTVPRAALNVVGVVSATSFYGDGSGLTNVTVGGGSAGDIKILDDISGSFNGVTTSFALTSSGGAITPSNSQSLIVNLGGVIQDPSDDYSVSGSSIVFSNAPESGLSFSGVYLNFGAFGTIADGAVTPSKLSTGGPWWTTGGNLGIGTTIPTAKLHIVGDTLITGVTTTTSLSMGGNTVSSLGVGIATAGGLIGVGATILDFRGAGISTITVASGIATINVTGGGSGGGASVSISTTAPVSPSAGDLWYNSNLGRTFIYYNDGDSSQWVDAAPFNIPQDDPVAAKNTTTFTATAGQTTFVVSYTVGYIDVYLNGVRLSSNEFIESGSSVVLLEAASEGDVLDVVEYTMGKGDKGDTGSGGPLQNITISADTNTYYPIFAVGIGTTTPYINTTSNYFNFIPSSGTLSVNQLNVIGVSTFTNGPILIGSSSLTGTTSQRLQVTGGAYVSGNVGVGTTNPQYSLDVLGDINFTGTFRQNGSQFVASRWTSGTGDDIYRLNGDVGIGTTNPTSNLHVIGNAYITGIVTATDFNSTSDINFKKNIKVIDNPISKVLQIKGITFDWSSSNQSSAGVIAQDVERVLPEIVKETEDHKTVNYNGLIGLLIEVVKDQQEQINMLSSRIEKLEG